MRDWWLRTLLVFQRPRPVFVALRDDGKEASADRAEPIFLIVVLAGIAAVLMTRTAAHLMDDGTYDGIVTAIWAFFVGSLFGVFWYFAFGALLYWCGRLLGSQGTYRRARHVLAFAAAPVALSLVLWPVKLSLYGIRLVSHRRARHRGGRRRLRRPYLRVLRLGGRPAGDRRARGPWLDVVARARNGRAHGRRAGGARDGRDRAVGALENRSQHQDRDDRRSGAGSEGDERAEQNDARREVPHPFARSTIVPAKGGPVFGVTSKVRPQCPTMTSGAALRV